MFNVFKQFFFRKSSPFESKEIATPFEPKKTFAPDISESLTTINWGKLTHAYGAADDVPDLLHALTSQESEVRESAYEKLYGNVIHQGSRYPATIQVIPILFETLDVPQTPDKSALILYIVDLALGFPERYLPMGIDDEPFGYDTVEGKCWKRFFEGQKSLLVQTRCDDLNTRLCAAYALGFQGKHLGKDALERLEEIATTASLAQERANALLVLGLVEHSRKKSELKSLFRTLFLHPELSNLEKMAAATSLLVSDGFEGNEDAMLYLAQLSSEEQKNMEGKFPFYDGYVRTHISDVLSLAEGKSAEVAIHSLAQALPDVPPDVSLEITSNIFRLIWRTHQDSNDECSFEDFSVEAQYALRAIGKYGAWTINTMGFGNYSRMVAEYGFPAQQEAFLKFVGEDMSFLQENKGMVMRTISRW